MNKFHVKCTNCQYDWDTRTSRMPKACPNCASRATRHPIVKVTQEAQK